MKEEVDVIPLVERSLKIPVTTLHSWRRQGWLKLWPIAGGWGLRAEHQTTIDAITAAAKR